MCQSSNQFVFCEIIAYGMKSVNQRLDSDAKVIHSRMEA